MGIDIYAAWRGRSGTKKADLITGFSGHFVHVGYLLDSYYGGSYATHVLVPEAFARPAWVEVSARLLRERLPRVLKVAQTHELLLYGVLDEKRFGAVARSLSDFVALCEAKEQETGQPCLIRAAE